jgi:ABC-type glycerol-3-phosphate transport system substrate-binding protein
MGDPAFREAANYLFGFITKHKVAADAAVFKELGGHWQMFGNGKLATSLSLIWVLAPFKAIKSFQWDVAKPLKKKDRGAYIDGYALSISTSAKSADDAWKFLAYYGSRKGSETVLKFEYGIPLHKGLLPDVKGPLGKAAELAGEARITNKRYAHTNEFTNKEINPRWDLVRNGQLESDKAIDELLAAWPKYVPAS